MPIETNNLNRIDTNLSNSEPELPELMDQKELAQYLGTSEAWCERSRWAGEGPRFLKLGRHVRYRVADVLNWVESNTHSSTSD